MAETKIIPAIALQSFLEQRIDMEVARLREAIETHISHVREGSYADKAELARRLDILNHAHDQARETLATYIPRELFDAKVVELEKRVSALDLWRAGSTALVVGITIGVAAATGGIVSLLVSAFKP